MRREVNGQESTVNGVIRRPEDVGDQYKMEIGRYLGKKAGWLIAVDR
jgi:hypothetical protein